MNAANQKIFFCRDFSTEGLRSEISNSLAAYRSPLVLLGVAGDGRDFVLRRSAQELEVEETLRINLSRLPAGKERETLIGRLSAYSTNSRLSNKPAPARKAVLIILDDFQSAKPEVINTALTWASSGAAAPEVRVVLVGNMTFQELDILEAQQKQRREKGEREEREEREEGILGTPVQKEKGRRTLRTGPIIPRKR